MTARKLQIHSEINLDDLVEEIVTLDDKSIFELIKSIDSQVAEYNFTKKLRDYFVNEMEYEDAAAKTFDKIGSN